MEENKELELNNEECNDEGYVDSEEAMGQIAVQQELERWELQNDPISELSEGTADSKFFKESIIYAETIGTAFQTLLGYGIDYQNAISIANNMMINDQNLKQTKVQSIQVQTQQL